MITIVINITVYLLKISPQAFLQNKKYLKNFPEFSPDSVELFFHLH